MVAAPIRARKSIQLATPPDGTCVHAAARRGGRVRWGTVFALWSAPRRTRRAVLSVADRQQRTLPDQHRLPSDPNARDLVALGVDRDVDAAGALHLDALQADEVSGA